MLLSDDLITHRSTVDTSLPVLNNVFRGSHLSGFAMPSAGLLAPRMKPTLDVSCVL